MSPLAAMKQQLYVDLSELKKQHNERFLKQIQEQQIKIIQQSQDWDSKDNSNLNTTQYYETKYYPVELPRQVVNKNRLTDADLVRRKEI